MIGEICPCVGAGLIRRQNARVPRSGAQLRALRLRCRTAQEQSPAAIAEIHTGLSEGLSDFKDLVRLIQAPSTYPVQKGSPWGFGHADPDLVGRVLSVAAFVPIEKE